MSNLSSHRMLVIPSESLLPFSDQGRDINKLQNRPSATLRRGHAVGRSVDAFAKHHRSRPLKADGNFSKCQAMLATQ